MKSITKKFQRLAWNSLASVIVLAAIGISLIRLALPTLANQHDFFASNLGEFIERPVALGEIEMRWLGWAPDINIHALSILDSESRNELVHFESAQIELDLIASVKRLAPVPKRLVVSGMKVALQRDDKGNISIAGMPPSRWPVAQWILQQENFVLTNATLSFQDLSKSDSAVQFDNVLLSVGREGDEQIVRARLRNADNEAETYRFDLRYTGDVLTSDWAGKIYFEITNAKLENSLALIGLERVGSGGTVNAQAWTEWDEAKLRSASVNLDCAEVRLEGKQTPFLDSFNTHAVATRQADGWSLNFHKVIMQRDGVQNSLDEIALRWHRREQNKVVVAATAKLLNLASLTDLNQDLKAFGHAENSPWLSYKFSGSAKDLRAVALQSENGIDDYYAEAMLENIAIADETKGIAIENIGFGFRLNSHSADFDLAQTQAFKIQHDERLVEPIRGDKIVGRLSYSRNADGVTWRSPGIQFRAETIDIETRGSVAHTSSKGTYLDIVGAIREGQLANLSKLIPRKTLPTRGDNWIRSALVAGRIDSSALAIRGYAKDFPFDQAQGTLKVSFELKNADFQYGKRWPIANGIDATIDMRNRSVRTKIHKGSIYGARVDGSTIDMPDYFTRKPVVSVRGETQVAQHQLTRFIENSPLKATKAARLKDVEIAGEFGMTLDMNLGIYPGGEKEILGLAHFAGNDIASGAQNIRLNDVHGDISFTRQDWYGEGLRAIFDGDAVGVILNGGLDDPNYDTEIRLTGKSSAARLLKHLERYAPVLKTWLMADGDHQIIDGELPWKAVLTIPEATSGADVPKRLRLESSLLGLDIDLPWPFAKTSAETKPLSIETSSFATGARQLKIEYGSTVNALFHQQAQSDGRYRSKSGEIVFGEDTPRYSSTAGLHLRGNVIHLPLSDWIKFVRKMSRSMNRDTPTQAVSFDLNLKQLEFLGRKFHDTAVKGDNNNGSWSLQIESADVAGNVTIPPATTAEPWLFNFERLWLTQMNGPKSAETADPRSLPAFDLTADSFRYGGLDLGRAKLVTQRHEHGLSIASLNLSHPHFELHGDGVWLLDNEVMQSQINLNVSGPSLAGVLTSFNYDVANIDGGATEIAIRALWPGMPSQFTLDKLNGNFSLSIDEGRFLDIEPGGGRLFGLLSLQTLPRRLSLDFNDLFKKGFAFDNIQGSFELDAGNAYTNSLLMNGPSARIDVSGRTGLADQDYDQRVTVTPALSDTIPVASALFGPAGIGVGAVIFLGQKVFKSIPEQVDKFLSREYSITGDWREPVIERI